MVRASLAPILLAACLACDPAPQPPAAAQTPQKAPAPTTPTPPPVATPAKLAEPEPDPITRPYDEAMARDEASRLAERAFAARKDLVGADGKPVGPHEFPPGEFVGGLEGKRWKLRNEPPAGAWARVEFGEFGDNPKVEVGFAGR
jgi:hypothetical protein